MYLVLVVLALVSQIAYCWWYHTNKVNLVVGLTKLWKTAKSKSAYDDDTRWIIILALMVYWLGIPFLGLISIIIHTGAFAWYKYNVMDWLKSQGKETSEESE